MKSLVVLLMFSLSLAASARGRFGVSGSYCDGEDMMSNYNTVMYSFSSSADCNRALGEARSNSFGVFCDRENLISADGRLYNPLKRSSLCQSAIAQLRTSNTGLYCNDRDLYQMDVGYVFFFKFSAHCNEAIEHARKYRGMFCKEGQMFDQFGRLVRDYDYRSSCIDALKKITF
jgi:hypothetical protein